MSDAANMWYVIAVALHGVVQQQETQVLGACTAC